MPFFYRLNLIESYGTGIRKIIRLYKDFSKQSVFQSAEGVFSVTLTNQNDNLSESKNSPNTQNKMIDSKDIKDQIYEMVKEKGSSSRKEIEETFDISSTKSYLILRELCEEGLLLRKLNGRKITYIAL